MALPAENKWNVGGSRPYQDWVRCPNNRDTVGLENNHWLSDLSWLPERSNNSVHAA
jgi:hypothetical protein